MRIRSVRVHHVDLIALSAIASRLKNDPLSVGRPVGLGILASMRQLDWRPEKRRLAMRGNGKGNQQTKDGNYRAGEIHGRYCNPRGRGWIR